MWGLPRPGIEPVSPALASKFLTTGPQRKSKNSNRYCFSKKWNVIHLSLGVTGLRDSPSKNRVWKLEILQWQNLTDTTLIKWSRLTSVQFSSVAQSCPTLCDPMNHSIPIHHQLPESTQTHVYWVGDAIQPSHPLSSPFLLPSIFPSIRVF